MANNACYSCNTMSIFFVLYSNSYCSLNTTIVTINRLNLHLATVCVLLTERLECLLFNQNVLFQIFFLISSHTASLIFLYTFFYFILLFFPLFVEVLQKNLYLINVISLLASISYSNAFRVFILSLFPLKFVYGWIKKINNYVNLS